MIARVFLIVLLAAARASAQGAGRLFGDFRLGAGHDDSVLRNATGREDRFLAAAYGLGWRGRPDPLTTARAYYQFSLDGHARQAREDTQRHLLTAEFSRRVADPARLLLDGEAEWHRLPGRPAFNTLRVSAAPGAEYRPLVETAFRAYLTYDVERYPNFDLDWNALGWRLELEQELGLDGSASVAYSQRRREFTERTLFADAAGTPSSRRRADAERSIEAAGKWDWRRGKARAGCSWSDVRSNGDRLDWGPEQSEAANTVVGDERLIVDYFSRSSYGPFVGVGVRLPGRVLVEVDHRWTLVRYSGRPAKDEAERFVSGGGVRRDWRRLLSFEATWLFGLWGRQLGLSAGWTRERSSSTDALYTFTRNRPFVSLRGWF